MLVGVHLIDLSQPAISMLLFGCASGCSPVKPDPFYTANSQVSKMDRRISVKISVVVVVFGELKFITPEVPEELLLVKIWTPSSG